MSKHLNQLSCLPACLPGQQHTRTPPGAWAYLATQILKKAARIVQIQIRRKWPEHFRPEPNDAECQVSGNNRARLCGSNVKSEW